MATVIRLYHDKHKDLVADEKGDIIVQTANGEERRSATSEKLEGGYTTLELPEGYDPSMTALSHLIDGLTSRHFDPDDVFAAAPFVTGGGKADANVVKIGKRIAGMLDAEWADDEDAARAVGSGAKK